MKAQPCKQKSLSVSNKSNRVERKSESKRKTTNTLHTLQEKGKQGKRFSHLSKTLNFSKSKPKNYPTSAKYSLTNQAGRILTASGSKNKNKNRKEGNPESRLGAEYKEAINKVFNVLDIFSRGTISQANISRWVPEAALYFLGSVFQKIRNHRVVLNLQQFQSQCYKIFEKSAQSDVRCFIQNIFKHQNFNEEKISLDGQFKETIQSHVEDRLSFLVEGETSFRQRKPTQKMFALPLQTKTGRQNLAKQTALDNQKKQRQKIQKAKVAPLNNINSFQNVAIRKHRKVAEVQNLPLQTTLQENGNKNAASCLNGFHSPFFQGSISNVIARTVSNRRRQNMESEKFDRIDKLSMRLEDYIKENAARIERSKNCRIQL